MLHIEDLVTPPEGFLRDEPEGAEFYQAFQTARLDDSASVISPSTAQARS
jgi:hypothetical protein